MKKKFLPLLLTAFALVACGGGQPASSSHATGLSTGTSEPEESSQTSEAKKAFTFKESYVITKEKSYDIKNNVNLEGGLTVGELTYTLDLEGSSITITNGIVTVPENLYPYAFTVTVDIQGASILDGSSKKLSLLFGDVDNLRFSGKTLSSRDESGNPKYDEGAQVTITYSANKHYALSIGAGKVLVSGEQRDVTPRQSEGTWEIVNQLGVDFVKLGEDGKGDFTYLGEDKHFGFTVRVNDFTTAVNLSYTPADA